MDRPGALGPGMAPDRACGPRARLDRSADAGRIDRHGRLHRHARGTVRRAACRASNHASRWLVRRRDCDRMLGPLPFEGGAAAAGGDHVRRGRRLRVPRRERGHHRRVRRRLQLDLACRRTRVASWDRGARRMRRCALHLASESRSLQCGAEHRPPCTGPGGPRACELRAVGAAVRRGPRAARGACADRDACAHGGRGRQPRGRGSLLQGALARRVVSLAARERHVARRPDGAPPERHGNPLLRRHRDRACGAAGGAGGARGDRAAFGHRRASPSRELARGCGRIPRDGVALGGAPVDGAEAIQRRSVRAPHPALVQPARDLPRRIRACPTDRADASRLRALVGPARMDARRRRITGGA